MKEVYYKLSKSKIKPLTKKEKESVKEYQKYKDNMERSLFPPQVIVEGNFISFHSNKETVKINLWSKGTCLSLDYGDIILIHNFIKDKDKLLTRLASEQV